MKPVCYLDMDEVLVDFVRGALAFHGKTFPYRELTWDFPAQIGFVGDLRASFWEPLGFEFWANLGWTREGKAILAHVEETFGHDNVILMSSPCLTPGCAEGKIAWIRRELPAYSRRFSLTPAKHLVAGPTKVLVDDREQHCDAFEDEGGSVVLVPRPWNRHRELTDENGHLSDRALDAFLRNVRGAYTLAYHACALTARYV
jgi:hypothetical protein